MTDASWLERAVLVVILLTSLTLFWWRFRKVLNVIRGSRATTDFEVSPLGPRIKQFLWEVMLQGKVIEQRPLPGLAHAFVYWGFLAFALVTINHIASAFGARFLSQDSGFGSFYLVVRRGVGGGGGRLDRGAVRAPLRRAARVAGQSGAGIGIHRIPDLHADGDVSCRTLAGRGIADRAGRVVAAHHGAADLPAADSAHQASPPGAESGHRIPQTSGLQPDSAAGRR